jgi:UDP-glucose 4-epimerase
MSVSLLALSKKRGAMRTILVTGGAGYIGSHIVEQLASRGDHVIILDSRVYGQPWPIQAMPVQAMPVQMGPPISGAMRCEKGACGSTCSEQRDYGTVSCVEGECGDKVLLDQLFSENKIDAVIHCAALIEVGISVKEPLNFYNTNVAQTITLLERMKAHKVNTIVFSSSAAVYGNPGVDLIAETAACVPLNPYGQSKLFIEHVLADCATAYGLKYAALRYFNVAGAYPEKGLGERHKPETHVVPLLLKAAVEGTLFNLYSADYGTADGTCIRDYVHVRDIARANVLALDALCAGAEPLVVNIGSGNGISVLDLVHIVEQVAQHAITTRVVERRAGDGARLVADATQVKKLLGWTPRFPLEQALGDAYRFHGDCGYGDRLFLAHSHKQFVQKK